MKVKSNGTTFGMHDRLYKQLLKFTTEQMKKKDNNKIFLVCGDTGVGKSAFAFQCCAVIDKAFGLNSIKYTNSEMQNGLRNMQNRAIVFDEAFRGMSGRNVMQKQQKKILEMLYEIRQLNQVVFLLAPSFFRLDEAISYELADALFLIKKMKSGKRMFKIFNKKKKNQLFDLSKKLRKKSYNLVPSYFKGYFPKTYVVDEEVYRKNKFDSLHGDKEDTKGRDNDQREARLLRALHDLLGSYGKVSKHIRKHGIILVPGSIFNKMQALPDDVVKSTTK